jgi:hypothetical protein
MPSHKPMSEPVVVTYSAGELMAPLAITISKSLP